MSWFGETFGDSLSSLKGQITKITKEVLADDEGSAHAVEETSTPSVKELKALCESKDLEIASLREEFNKLQCLYKSEKEILKNQNIEFQDSPATQAQLQNELLELRQERDHLNSCLDELQSEHQINLNQVILIRDKYKIELESLQKQHEALKTKLEESINDQFNSSHQENFLRQIEEKNNEIDSLKNKIETFQYQINAMIKEKEEEMTAIKLKLEDNNKLKEQVEQLSNEISVVEKNKQLIEEDNKILRNEKNSLTAKLDSMEKNTKEMEINLKILTNEKEEIYKKFENLKNKNPELEKVTKFQKEVQNKVKDLLQTLNFEINEDINENNIVKFLSMVETEWKTFKSESQISNEKVNKINCELESNIKKLEEENASLKKELKTCTEKWEEIEKKYCDEINSYKNTISEMKAERQKSLNECQTDDVKKLEQEIAQYMNLILVKNNEIKDFTKSINNLEQELHNSKLTLSCKEQDITNITEEKSQLEEEIKQIKTEYSNLSHNTNDLETKFKNLESKIIDLEKINFELKAANDVMEKQLLSVNVDNEKINVLQIEINKIKTLKTEAENVCNQLQKANFDLKNELEHLKAQIIVKEANSAELIKSNSVFQEEINKLKAQNSELQNFEKEIKKWKEASVDLEIQRQDLLAKKDELEIECLKLKSELELSTVKDAEISQLKFANSNLTETCNKLHYDLESKIQAENIHLTRENELVCTCQKQTELIAELKEENNELKTRIQKFQDQMKLQMVQSQNSSASLSDVQHHRRTKSAVDLESSSLLETKIEGNQLNEEISLLKQALQQEQVKYRSLQNNYQDMSDKEANARKEFERLKEHLLEIEDHYTEEAVENEKTINELKSKLIAAEEQLQNSSTLYTSMKVRDNQHLESLQSQIRMISNQRDDYQAKLSAAEDEVQKHKASLMSLQIVLEQFQQDKERELEEVAIKCEHQIQLTHDHYKNMEKEIEGLKKQLTEAKNGLKAASRLGEQLEKKTQQVNELEKSLMLLKSKNTELESNLDTANKSSNAKIDKSLIKNLIVGYILSPNTERKSQVLKIMASVLDFDSEERNKLGVDNTSSGWLSSILHPKGGGAPSNQSLSEAFIKFLENESRPQPQVKFLPEQFERKSSTVLKPTSDSPQLPGRFSELMLPTFNSSQENESSVILKNVLKES